jgi:hypothetical protein
MVLDNRTSTIPPWCREFVPKIPASTVSLMEFGHDGMVYSVVAQLPAIDTEAPALRSIRVDDADRRLGVELPRHRGRKQKEPDRASPRPALRSSTMLCNRTGAYTDESDSRPSTEA